MKYRELGNSGMEVSVIGYGAWPSGGEWTESEDQGSKEAIEEAIDLGVNFFDVAPVYGFCHAEKLLGEVLEDHRDEVFIATKCGLRWDDSRNIVRNLSRESIFEEIEDSLERLSTDYVDLYQLHWPDPNTPISETMEAVKELKEEGKIRHIGVSNFSRFLMNRARKHGEIVSNQVLYNMIDRDSENYHDLPLAYRTESEILPYCWKNNVGVIPYSPIAQGMLTDGFDIEKLDSDDVRFENPQFKGERLEKNLKIVRELREIAEDIDKPLVQVALNWLLEEESVSSIIVGTTNPKHIRENVGALDWELDNETLGRIESVLKDEK